MLLDLIPQDIQGALERIRSATAQWVLSGQPGSGTARPDPVGAGDRVVQMLTGWLLDDEQKAVLTSDERSLYYLQAAAWLIHLDGCQETDLDAPSVAPIIRRSQGATSGAGAAAIIRKHWPQLGIGNDYEARLLSAICRAALQDPFSHPEALAALENGKIWEGGTGHSSLVAAGIHLAHALDLKHPASLGRLLGFLTHEPPQAAEALCAGFDVIALGAHPYLAGTLRIKIRCREAELHRALKHHEHYIQRLLERLNKRVIPRFLFSAVRYDIEPEGYTPLDMKFSVDSSAALQLFTGNRLYADKRTFLRELVQNAVDACRLKSISDPSYVPDIALTFNEDISTVTIRDNGVGMDRQWLEKYFLKIGISFYQSDDIRQVDRDTRFDVTFISQFGIGFLSSFLVADQIVIRTRRAPDRGLQITITSLRDYFDVRPLKDAQFTGTEVTLHLAPSRINYSRHLEFVGYLKTNIRFLSVPVRLTDQKGRTTLIGNEPLAYATDPQRGTAFAAALDFEHSQGHLLVKAVKQTDYIQGVEPAHGGIAVFQDGIFVTQLDSLLPEGARQNVIGRINLLGPERCELSMDRNRIFWKKHQLDDVKRRIHHALVSLVDQFVAALDAQEIPETLRTAIINQLSIFFDINALDDAMVEVLPAPIKAVIEKRFRDFIRIHYRHTRPADGIPGGDEYGQRWQRTIMESFRRRAV
jgi:hypothetical protein